MTEVKIEFPSQAATQGKILIDGVDVSSAVTRISLDASVKDVVRVDLTLMPRSVYVELRDPHVTIDGATAAVLAAAGWTPPSGMRPAPTAEQVGSGSLNLFLDQRDEEEIRRSVHSVVNDLRHWTRTEDQ